MDQTLHAPETYDYRRYDRIWQRVSPTLEPYPAAPEDTTTALTTRQEAQLPGADINPCCLGSAATEMLEVLTG